MVEGKETKNKDNEQKMTINMVDINPTTSIFTLNAYNLKHRDHQTG